MTRLGITSAMVEEAAENILMQGENPTIERIRRQLGTGSNSTITKYLNEWRANRLMASKDKLPSSNNPPDPVHAAVNQVWEKIHNESEEKIKSFRDQAEAEISLARKERDNAFSLRDQAQLDYENLQKRFNQISSEKELLVLDLKSIQQEHILLKEKYQNLDKAYQHLENQSNDKIALLERVNQKEIENKLSEIQNLKSACEQSVNKIAELNENQRQQYIVEIENYKVTIKKHEKKIEELNPIIQNLRFELNTAQSIIKSLSHEKDATLAECQYRQNQIEQNNNNIINSIKTILSELSDIKNSANNNADIYTDLKSSNNHFESLLKLILNAVSEKKEKITE